MRRPTTAAVQKMLVSKATRSGRRLSPANFGLEEACGSLAGDLWAHFVQAAGNADVQTSKHP